MPNAQMSDSFVWYAASRPSEGDSSSNSRACHRRDPLFAAVAVSTVVAEMRRWDMPKSMINGIPAGEITTFS